MNRYIVYIFSLTLMVAVNSCSEKPSKANVVDSNPVKKNFIVENSNKLDIKDCLPELKNTGKLIDQIGSIHLVSDVFVILTENEAIRYHACNLPLSYRIDGLSVIFSIVAKELPMNAKMVGLPAILTEIKIN